MAADACMMPFSACCYAEWWPKWGGVFGTRTYPRLILPYSAYYGHLAPHHMYVGPWCPRIAWRCDFKKALSGT
jgi:hypothetical protein